MTNHPTRNWRRRAVKRAVLAFRSAKERLPPGDMDISVVVYPDDTSFLRHRLDDWPALENAHDHREFIETSIVPALRKEGACVRLVVLNDGRYQRWLADREDSETLRAAWAAEQQ